MKDAESETQVDTVLCETVFSKIIDSLQVLEKTKLE